MWSSLRLSVFCPSTLHGGKKWPQRFARPGAQCQGLVGNPEQGLGPKWLTHSLHADGEQLLMPHRPVFQGP